MILPPVSISRRAFLRRASAALATASTVSIVPGAVLGLRGAPSPNSKLNIACIGVGGRGGANLSGVSRENIVALCDVDEARAGAAFDRFDKARRFRDFRRLFDAMEREIDAVTVSTPDHTHAAAVLRAIEQGKHVYCEKPLAHSMDEVHRIRQAARAKHVITQLGNQGHSFDSIRVFVEWVQAGLIGRVREIHARCGSVYSHIAQLDQVRQPQPVPPSLDWDLWLGPAAYRDYHSAYVPGKWRGWTPFGCGVIGDWVCHVVDPVFWALDLGSPIHVEADTGDYDPARHADTFPEASRIRYTFPARGNRPALTLTWYDGANELPRPDELPAGQAMPKTGALVVGDHGKITYGSHGASNPRLLPADKMAAAPNKPQRLAKSPGHHQEWIDACKTGKPAGSNFDYGAALTEIALLGIIAMRFKNRRLEWDASSRRFTNCPEADAYLRPQYRPGWGL
ncbi:MAG: Gfo/Idh/MocA family oxidoreductase [Verrucomicrobia bacterium]|nr:Gfo/Idh/MocA family oxidoreductase [Verrucomicrobiota bacterium]